MDPTLASNNSRKSVGKYIGDGKNLYFTVFLLKNLLQEANFMERNTSQKQLSNTELASFCSQMALIFEIGNFFH